ncbi:MULTISPECIES: hypothetical protein [Pseudanabaena]|uniref:Uncharacterized protein n=2 Tax=Pseudanabaena TaxID=1152 RepID=L8MXE4_9CYAN|nr:MULTISPECIES: hypothetical protein [Pseudanabaena]ELS30663.1 hypothetical protein Pse7429DRAFT_4176 [Pseudanabaena biceps PCC 7429]MDG3497068.1 hypothetical protein [Pseudanabaena catenata USMAC16]
MGEFNKMSCTGKIKNLVTTRNNPCGFILPDVNIDRLINHEIGFWANDVTDGLFSDLAVGDIVQFHPAHWTKRNGDIQLIARKIKSRMSGAIKFINVDPIKQTFWGTIQPDKNWLNQTDPIIFFRNSFKEQTLHKFIDFCGQSFNQNLLPKFIDGIRVDFAIQYWSNAKNQNFTKVAKNIKLIDAKSAQSPSTLSSTKLVKDKIINLLDRIEIVSNPLEFEDLVFTLLRLIGINKIYKYNRNTSSGTADGVFKSGNLSVIYDCTLRNPYRPHKDQQIFNYKKQLRSASSITINETRSSGKDFTKTFINPEKREVWIITRGETRIIEEPDKTDNICVREVSIESLIDVFSRKLDAQIFGKLDIN